MRNDSYEQLCDSTKFVSNREMIEKTKERDAGTLMRERKTKLLNTFPTYGVGQAFTGEHAYPEWAVIIWELSLKK